MDYFMLIPGLNGGSLNLQHKGWFEITGVDLDMEKSCRAATSRP